MFIFDNNFNLLCSPSEKRDAHKKALRICLTRDGELTFLTF